MVALQKRIGLIGLSAKGSWASSSHLGYLQKTNHYQITALQNSSKASAEAAAEKYELRNVATYENPVTIAADPNVDIVAVSVNVPQHYDLIRPALEAGKDVFSEWPLARNLSEAEELVSLAKSKGVKTMIGLQARQCPSIVKAKEIVASGKLGKVMSTSMYGNGSILGPTTTDSYVYISALENGANLVTIPFGHAVDALCYVLGEIQDIAAVLANIRSEQELLDQDGKPKGKVQKSSHDHVNINGRLQEGRVVNVTYGPAESRTGRSFYWEINGTSGTLVLEGGKMGGHIQMFQPTLKLATDDGIEEVLVEKATGLTFNVGKAWDAWAGVGLEQGYSVTTWDDALIRHKMIDAIYRSAERGTRENYV